MENTNTDNSPVIIEDDSNETITNIHYDAPESTDPVVDGDKVVEEVKEETTKKVEPWKQPKPEAKVPDRIPYDRFKDVVDEKNVYLNKSMELERKLAELETRQKELTTVKMPEDIKIEDYTPETVGDYLRDLQIATKNQTIKEVEERYIAREQERIAKEHHEAFVGQYANKIEESAKYNPDIKEAALYLEQMLAPETGHVLHSDLVYELMIDENAGELIYDIVTDEDLLKELFESNPKDMIRKIHKMSAKIDREARKSQSASSQPSKSQEPAVKVAEVKAMPKKLDTPVKIKSDVTGGKVDPSKMSTAEYKRYMKNGYKL